MVYVCACQAKVRQLPPWSHGIEQQRRWVRVDSDGIRCADKVGEEMGAVPAGGINIHQA